MVDFVYIAIVVVVYNAFVTVGVVVVVLAAVGVVYVKPLLLIPLIFCVSPLLAVVFRLDFAAGYAVAVR